MLPSGQLPGDCHAGKRRIYCRKEFFWREHSLPFPRWSFYYGARIQGTVRSLPLGFGFHK